MCVLVCVFGGGALGPVMAVVADLHGLGQPQRRNPQQVPPVHDHRHLYVCVCARACLCVRACARVRASVYT